MHIAVRRAEYRDVEPVRELYRAEARCQIIHDSALRRGLADAYVIEVDGRAGGYGGVWNRYHPGRVMEFHALPHLRAAAQPLFRALVEASGAKQVEAQTNMPLMLLMLYDCAVNVACENILFEDAGPTRLPPPARDAVFRAATPEERSPERDAPWVIEADGQIVSSGGFLTHYNPPYADVYMAVEEPWRRRGFGSYLVQEIKRRCYEAGYRPAARCNPDNVASRRTLQRAGLLPCGRLLAGELRPGGARSG